MYVTPRHGSAVYADGGSLSFTFADVGDLSIGPLGALQRELVPVMNRSDFAAWVEGPEQEIQFSFTYNLKGEAMISASAARALDAIRWTNTWSAGTTTNPGGFGAKVGTFIPTRDTIHRVPGVMALVALHGWRDTVKTIVGTLAMRRNSCQRCCGSAAISRV